MQTVEVRGQLRTAGGKSAVHQVRSEGRIPGIIYGKGEDNVSFSIEKRDFDGILRKHGGGRFLLDLKIEGDESRDMKALVKEVQRDPITSKVIHLDLLQVSLTQEIHTPIPIHVTGIPVGVKEGGLLEHITREIEIRCQVAKIPEDVKIDVTDLATGHSIHVSDLSLPEWIEVLTPGDRVIATVIAKAIAEPTPEELAAAEAAEAPEGEEKAEEEKTDESAEKK